MLFAYMTGGEELWGLEVSKCFVRGGQKGGQVQYLSLREKNNRPSPINKWLVPITKSPKGHYVAYLFFKILLVFAGAAT